MAAPAAFQKDQIQGKDPETGRNKARADAPDDLAPQEGLRVDPLKGGGAGDGRGRQGGHGQRIARVARQTQARG